MIIYVGDSRDVVKRIRYNHCRGNVEASALRRYIAEAKGYKIKSTKRSSGSTRIRIDLPDPKFGEREITDYIRGGTWRYVICDSYFEASDFQWYAIEQLNPLLNKDRGSWNKGNHERYQALLERLTDYVELRCDQLSSMPSGSGVYVLYHYKYPCTRTNTRFK